jgi:hypothetical protein
LSRARCFAVLAHCVQLNDEKTSDSTWNQQARAQKENQKKNVSDLLNDIHALSPLECPIPYQHTHIMHTLQRGRKNNKHLKNLQSTRSLAVMGIYGCCLDL